MLYMIMFFVCLGAGGMMGLLGASLLAMAIKRRRNPQLALFCAVPGVAFLTVTVFAVYYAIQLTHMKVPPGG